MKNTIHILYTWADGSDFLFKIAGPKGLDFFKQTHFMCDYWQVRNSDYSLPIPKNEWSYEDVLNFFGETDGNSMNDMEKLFYIADQAKKLQKYNLPNIIFGYLLDGLLEENSHLDMWCENTTTEELENEIKKVKILYETSDREEYDNYYDLLVLQYEDRSMCIPIPLLNQELLLYIFKSHDIEFIDRENHDRNYLDVSEEKEKEIEDNLWNQLFDIIDNGFIVFENISRITNDFSNIFDESIDIEEIEKCFQQRYVTRYDYYFQEIEGSNADDKNNLVQPA